MKKFINLFFVTLLLSLGQTITYGQVLGPVKGNSLQINSVTGNAGGNTFYNKQWLVRNEAGSDWVTASLHDGIAIDGSFHVPMSTSKTWWERNPNLGTQSWGSGTETFMILNNGRLSIQAPINGWQLNVRAYTPNAGDMNGLKFINGYPNESNKWAGVAAIAENTHSNSTGLSLYAGQTERVRIASGGNVGIGTTNPTEKLAVNGTIRSKEIKVESANWPDYVFEEAYQMKSLPEVEAFIKANKHLPGIPKAAEVQENGVELGEMNRKLLEKVEELTLYLIQEKASREEQIKFYSERIEILEDKLKDLVIDKQHKK